MKKSVKRWGIMLCITALFLCSAAWGEDALIATVTGDNVNLRLSPSVNGKKQEDQAGRGDIYIVDSKPIYDKEGKMNWFKILYWYWDSEGYLVELNTLYISSKFVKIKPMDKEFRDFFQEEKKAIARDKVYQKSGEWRITNHKEGYEDTTFSYESKPILLYTDPDLKSPVIAKLDNDIPILISVIKMRYKKSGGKEGWFKITKPMTGWLPEESVGVWYSDIFFRI